MHIYVIGTQCKKQIKNYSYVYVLLFSEPVMFARMTTCSNESMTRVYTYYYYHYTIKRVIYAIESKTRNIDHVYFRLG